MKRARLIGVNRYVDPDISRRFIPGGCLPVMIGRRAGQGQE